MSFYREKLVLTLPRGGRRKISSAFLSRRPFGYYFQLQDVVPHLQPSSQTIAGLKLWFQSDLLEVTKV